MTKNGTQPLLVHIPGGGFGAPVGEHSTELRNFIGWVVRDIIKCPVGEWEDASKGLQRLMWEQIQVKDLFF